MLVDRRHVMQVPAIPPGRRRVHVSRLPRLKSGGGIWPVAIEEWYDTRPNHRLEPLRPEFPWRAWTGQSHLLLNQPWSRLPV